MGRTKAVNRKNEELYRIRTVLSVYPIFIFDCHKLLKCEENLNIGSIHEAMFLYIHHSFKREIIQSTSLGIYRTMVMLQPVHTPLITSLNNTINTYRQNEIFGRGPSTMCFSKVFNIFHPLTCTSNFSDLNLIQIKFKERKKHKAPNLYFFSLLLTFNLQ